jgi:hypothetical protein
MQALALESELSSKAAGVPGDFSLDGNQLNEILDGLKQSDSALSSSRTLGLTKKLIDENLSEIPSCYGSSHRKLIDFALHFQNHPARDILCSHLRKDPV